MQHVIQSKWCMNPPFPLTSRKLIRSEIYLQNRVTKSKIFCAKWGWSYCTNFLASYIYININYLAHFNLFFINFFVMSKKLGILI
jgi:hypothetical protein